MRARPLHAIREDLSTLVKQAYTDERRNWHCSRGGRIDDYRPGKQWDPIWPKMADFFLNHKVDNFRAFIHLQFTTHANLSCCPSPKQCYGPAALRKWKEQKPRDKEIALSLHLQMGKMQQELGRFRNWHKEWTERSVETMVLFDEENGLTALFRYCMAKKIAREDIAAEYYEPALMQYVFGQEVFDKVWKDLIPRVLKDEATRVRLSYLVHSKY